MQVFSAIALGMSLSGCALVPLGNGAPEASTTSTGTSSAKARTPLEMRDALDRLDVFGECTDPMAPTNDYTGPEVALVACFVLPRDARSGVYAGRHVFVVVAREDWAGVKRGVCNTESIADDLPIVTDDRTFYVLGALQEQSTTSGLWGWPDEVWPEDVQRALGGAVVTRAELCSAP